MHPDWLHASRHTLTWWSTTHEPKPHATKPLGADRTADDDHDITLRAPSGHAYVLSPR